MAAPGTTKTSWKLQEIVAHASNVTAVALGKSSGRLLATGGEDCRVNLWSVNKPNCIMSLTGHTSPVESVRFNSSEKLIVAGSQSGSLRVWNMEEAKIQRTLTGHKANVCSLDFLPYGDFVASGSQDTNIKLWDMRRKGCVFRYKGHTQAVRCLRFSPDGKWLASSSDDHTVKLWDLTGGKVMAEYTEHSGPVHVVEFHPNEYLLASASGDRTVRFWDLEKFQPVGCVEGEATPFRTILFSSDGGCLFCGGKESLRVYGWEPERSFDTVPVTWGKVSDLSICNSQLIGVSIAGTNVSSFVVDLNRVKTSGSQGLLPAEIPVSQDKPSASSIRRIYERPSTTCTKPKRVSPSSEDDERESRAEIQNPDEYNEIFQPKSAISRTPPRDSEPFPAPPEDESVTVKEAALPAPEVVTPVTAARKNIEQLSRPPVAASTPTVAPDPPSAAPSTPTNPPVISAARNEPIGLKVADFLPVTKGSSPTEIPDEEAVGQIRKGHDTMCMVLTNRMRNLETVRAVWSTGDVKTSMDSAVAVNDLSVVVDLLNIVNQKPSLWKLDLCLTVLPQIDKLLQSKYESYVQTGCISLKLVLQRFLPLITETLAAPPSVGVDISREERLLKCKLCYKQLRNLSALVKSRASQSGRHGSAFRELHLLMSALE